MGLLIGISGQTKSGKDTVADYLCENYNFYKMALADPMKVFAKNLFAFNDKQLWGSSEFRNRKDFRYTAENDMQWSIAEERFSFYSKILLNYLIKHVDFLKSYQAQLEAKRTLEIWFKDLKKNHPHLSPRIMLQTLGSEWGRSLDENLWIDCLIKRAQKFTKNVIVSDVRFQNEISRIKESGGRVIRVSRPETDNQAESVGIKGHTSETQQKLFTEEMFDGIIINDSTLEDLYIKIDLYMRTELIFFTPL